MNKKLFIKTVSCLLIVTAGGYVFWKNQNKAPTTVILQGNVDIREVDLAFRQPGRLAVLNFDEGEMVKQGQLLAELDATPYEEALALAQANRAQALADRDKARRGSRTQEIEQAAAAVDQAKASAAEAQRNFVRQESLVKSGAASDRTLEAARSLRDQTSAALASAEQEYSLRKEGFRKEDIAAAEARFTAAEAQLDQSRTALSDTRLIAPSDGLISERVLEPGSMVTVNSSVYTLSLQEPIYVRAYVSQPQLTRVRPGNGVTVKADGTDKVFRGTIGFISPKAEFTPKSVETTELRTDLVYRVRIVIPDAAQTLRQGMPVTVVVDEDNQHPQGALTHNSVSE